MKAEQRHQLHTNALADRVGRIVKGMRSSPSSTSPLVWVFILLALGTIGIWQYFAQATQTDRSELWTALDGAQHDDPLRGMNNLEKIHEDYRGTFPARTAAFDLARIEMAAGQSNLNSIQRSDAIEQVKKARKRYEKLAGECADSPLLAQEALMGIATANECLVGTDGAENTKTDLERAVADYRKLATTYPDSYLGKEAARRVQRLEEQLPQITKFYEELSELTAHKGSKDIKPPELPKTGDSSKPSAGPDLPPLPDMPKLSEPQPSESKAKDAKPAEPKANESKSDGEPKAKDAKPVESKPPEPKANEPKPPESKAKGDSKPAPKGP